MKQNQIFTLLYGILMSLILLNPIVGDIRLYHFTKPLIMISLMLWVVLLPDSRPVRGKKIFVAGMLFALLGDCLLMIGGYFLHGLSAFLVMQWCYLIAFRKDFKETIPLKNALLWLLPVVISTGILLSFLLESISDTIMAMAIVVYTFSISMMFWFAILRKFSVQAGSYISVATGALLFVISDSLIAWNKFVSPVENSSFWVMLTYMLAQYLITRGMFKLPA
jgi:uncharacterized membrane protein YhhN